MFFRLWTRTPRATIVSGMVVSASLRPKPEGRQTQHHTTVGGWTVFVWSGQQDPDGSRGWLLLLEGRRHLFLRAGRRRRFRGRGLAQPGLEGGQGRVDLGL